jgi:hypothetical protein
MLSRSAASSMALLNLASLACTVAAGVARAVDDRVGADRQQRDGDEPKAHVVDEADERKVQQRHAGVEVGLEALEVVAGRLGGNHVAAVQAAAVDGELEHGAIDEILEAARKAAERAHRAESSSRRRAETPR